MKIGINALYLLPGKVGGTEIYIRNLVKWLLKIDKDNTYVIFINKESRGIFDEFGSGIEVVLCPIQASSRPVRILWEQFMLPFQIWHYKINILLSAGMTSPFFCPSTSVLVIHDLQHINQPRNFSWFYLFFLKNIIYLSTKTADGIVVISEKVKQDLIKFYKIPPENIAVVHHAADHNMFFVRDKDEVVSVRVKYNLPERFVLYIASSLPHKNHERLLQAFRIVKERVPGIKLVLIGARDKGYDVISKRIKEIGLEDDIIFLGWLPFKDIPMIYCASDVFVFPSVHEGFGLPILEAMACGIPVVCSNIEPLTEVAGNAAFFVDPYSPSDIADGILSVIQDQQLQKNLIEKGFKKAGEFTWRNTALKTLSFLTSYKSGKWN